MQIVGPKLELRQRCEEILRSLPNWFGIEAALVQYAADTTRLPTFAALEGEHVKAFLTLRNHFPEAWELTCIAVDATHRGRGYGSALLMHAEAWLLSQGARFLQVKTIAATSPDPYYAETRRFYERRGFISNEVFPKLWDVSNPCLQLIKHLDDRSYKVTRILDIDPLSDAATALLREAAADIRPLYGEPTGPPWPTNKPLGPRDVYVAAFVDDEPVACGAIHEVDAVTCELRRMYTSRSHRRRGVARAILSHLHSEARRLGYERLRLETGNRQTPAMRLYESYGFVRIAPFGAYADDPTSVCYELPVGNRKTSDRL